VLRAAVPEAGAPVDCGGAARLRGSFRRHRLLWRDKSTRHAAPPYLRGETWSVVRDAWKASGAGGQTDGIRSQESVPPRWRAARRGTPRSDKMIKITSRI